MGQKAAKSLIIGSAPVKNVDEFVLSFAGNGMVHVLAKNVARYILFSRANLFELSGKISVINISLVKSILKIRPDIVYIVSGKNYWHDNVVNSVHLICKFALLNPKIFVVNFQGSLIQANITLGLFSLSSHVLVFSMLFVILALGCSLGGFGWEVVLLCLITELIFFGKRHFFSRSNTSTVQTKAPELIHLHDDSLGWRLTPSAISFGHFVSLESAQYHDFIYSHDIEGHRTTSLGPSSSGEKNKIIVAGCSFTYGAYLLDEETYPFQLQCFFSDHEVINCGVCGYSLLQTYFAVEKALSEYKSVKAVVLGFISALEARSCLNYERMRDIYPAKNPYIKIKNNKFKMFKPVGYNKFIFSENSITLKTIERALNKFRLMPEHSRTLFSMHTELMLKKIKRLCLDSSIPLLVACLDGSVKYYEFFHRNNFNWCICGVDIENNFYNLMPFDPHPNATANKQYSLIIQDGLARVLAGNSVQPSLEQYSCGMSQNVDQENTFIYTLF